MDQWSSMGSIFHGSVTSIPLRLQPQRHPQHVPLQLRRLRLQQILECDWLIGKVNLDIIFILLVDHVDICYN